MTRLDIVDGPIYNNHELCPQSDYLFSIDINYFENKEPSILDVYITTYGDGVQSIIFRNSGVDISEYGSMPFDCFYESATKVKDGHYFSRILGVLIEIGRIKITFERRCSHGEL